jgi:hypothetical protein
VAELLAQQHPKLIVSQMPKSLDLKANLRRNRLQDFDHSRIFSN